MKHICEYDELSENNIFNQVLKTTAVILLRQPSISLDRKTALKKVALFFHSIDTIDPSTIKWNMLRFQRNNQNYKMLLNICYFVLEYYRYHHPYLHTSAAQVKWNLDDVNDKVIRFLPVMQTDIMLKAKGKTLIIDTKYYGRTMQAQYDIRTLHSNNLYQIFTYVKNHDVGNTGDVAGMLMYAKTSESITPDCDFKISGNKISVKTLDLNVAFSDIAAQLDKIRISYFDSKSEN